MITLITPTGSRPQAFELCKKFIMRQTYKGPIQWIVVYDSKEAPDMSNFNKLKTEVEIVKGPKEWREGINTQRFNMDTALNHVKGEYVFIWEDDDWYAPDYIERYIWFMSKYDIVGECNNKYYNIERKSFKEWRNVQHASLCSTGLKKSKLAVLDRAVNSGELFFDIALWRMAKAERHNAILIAELGLNVGMKGLPGRLGIGGGHRPDTEGFIKDDKDCNVLKSWIGDDHVLYKEMTNVSDSGFSR